MAQIIFLPHQIEVDVESETKILVAARRSKVPIRFGCASCRCGTCGVAIKSGSNNLRPMADDEKNLLRSMNLATDGSVRLACRARIINGIVNVDLDFQDSYSPDGS